MVIIYDKNDCNRLYFINYEGKLKVLYIPFQVLCIQDTGMVRANTIVYVEAIAATSKDELLYIIYGTAHYWYCFYLVAKF